MEEQLVAAPPAKAKSKARKKPVIKFVKGLFYKVSWLDIVAVHGWVSLEDKSDPALCMSYGWCTSINDQNVRLSGTRGDNQDGSEPEYNQSISIPLGCIKSADVISPP